MRKWDYLSLSNKTGKATWKDYERSEWRHALALYDSAEIHVHNLIISQAGGDGIYVNRLTSSTVTAVFIDESYRNSMSIISASGLLVSDCTFSNLSYAGGTAPRLGIDLEPNGPLDSLERIVIRNCSVFNNFGGGFSVSFTGLSNLSRAIDVTFEQCTVNGAGCGGGFSAQTWRKSGTPAGDVRWSGGSIRNTKNPGIDISVPVATGMAVHVKDHRRGCAYGECLVAPEDLNNSRYEVLRNHVRQHRHDLPKSHTLAERFGREVRTCSLIVPC